MWNFSLTLIQWNNYNENTIGTSESDLNIEGILISEKAPGKSSYPNFVIAIEILKYLASRKNHDKHKPYDSQDHKMATKHH